MKIKRNNPAIWVEYKEVLLITIEENENIVGKSSESTVTFPDRPFGRQAICSNHHRTNDLRYICKILLVASRIFFYLPKNTVKIYLIVKINA